MGGCARCSICGINYPSYQSTCVVEGCGEPLTFFSSVQVDADWRDHVRSLNASIRAAQSPAALDEHHAHRLAKFESLGFAEYAAELLASSKDAAGFPLWWGTVQSALSDGATHEQCLRIFV